MSEDSKKVNSVEKKGFFKSFSCTKGVFKDDSFSMGAGVAGKKPWGEFWFCIG